MSCGETGQCVHCEQKWKDLACDLKAIVDLAPTNKLWITDKGRLAIDDGFVLRPLYRWWNGQKRENIIIFIANMVANLEKWTQRIVVYNAQMHVDPNLDHVLDLVAKAAKNIRGILVPMYSDTPPIVEQLRDIESRMDRVCVVRDNPFIVATHKAAPPEVQQHTMEDPDILHKMGIPKQVSQKMGKSGE